MREIQVTSFLLETVTVKKNGKKSKAKRYVSTRKEIINWPGLKDTLEGMSKAGFDKIEIRHYLDSRSL